MKQIRSEDMALAHVLLLRYTPPAWGERWSEDHSQHQLMLLQDLEVHAWMGEIKWTEGSNRSQGGLCGIPGAGQEVLAAASPAVSWWLGCWPHPCDRGCYRSPVIFLELQLLQICHNSSEVLWEVHALADICGGQRKSEAAFSALHLKVVSKHHSTKAGSPPLPHY